MFRYSVLLCLSLMLYCTTASPYKSRGEEKHTAFQDTRSYDFNEKVMLGLKEVEPVEEQDLKEVDIDPQMAIWKVMKQFRQQNYNTPEEDKDKFYHPIPSEVRHFHEPLHYGQGQLYQEAEKDMDDVYHNIQGLLNHADLKEGVVQPEIPVLDKAKVVELHEKSVYMAPEEDKDGLYHEDSTGHVFQAPVMEDPPKKVYTEPEVDQDHLYHS